MAVHITLPLNINQYANEPIYIFINSLNSFYLSITQIKHPFLYSNHPNKTMFLEMIKLLQQSIVPTSLFKIRTHSNIEGNKSVDELSKDGKFKTHHLLEFLHEEAHLVSYYL